MQAHDIQYRKRDKREAELGKQDWAEDSIYTGFIFTVLSILAVCGIVQFIRLLIQP